MISTNPHLLLQSALQQLYERRDLLDDSRVVVTQQIVFGVLRFEINFDGQPFDWVGSSMKVWIADLGMYMTEGPLAIGYTNRFFRKIAIPLAVSHGCLKCMENPHRKQAAMSVVASMPDSEWKQVMMQFINQQPDKK